MDRYTIRFVSRDLCIPSIYYIILQGTPSQKNTHPNPHFFWTNTHTLTQYQRINQDTLGSRRNCETACRKALQQQQQQQAAPFLYKCPIVDRCNFDRQQRSHWYRIAAEACKEDRPTITIDIVQWSLPVQECIRRCQTRSPPHETLSPQDAPGVVAKMARQWQTPTLGEVQQISSSNNNKKVKLNRIRQIASGQDYNNVLMDYLGLSQEERRVVWAQQQQQPKKK